MERGRITPTSSVTGSVDTGPFVPRLPDAAAPVPAAAMVPSPADGGDPTAAVAAASGVVAETSGGMGGSANGSGPRAMLGSTGSGGEIGIITTVSKILKMPVNAAQAE